MADTAETGLRAVGDGEVLMARFYTLDLIDLLRLLANILRCGGYGLRQDIADRYTPRTVDLLARELDERTGLLLAAVNSPKDTQ